MSAPWVLAFYGFYRDSEALETPHYAEALAYSRARIVAQSRSVRRGRATQRPAHVPAIDFGQRAGGARVRDATASRELERAQRHAVAAAAAVECLPTTSKEMLVTLGDPLDVLWGADWVPSASANASATANAAGAPDSPSDSGFKNRNRRAPDLSRVGVDRRYVEIVRPR